LKQECERYDTYLIQFLLIIETGILPFQGKYLKGAPDLLFLPLDYQINGPLGNGLKGEGFTQDF